MAALWMLLACVFFAAMAAVIKVLALKVTVIEILFYRGFLNLIFISILMKIRGVSFKTQVPQMHILRSAFGAIAMYCGFYALAHLPLGTASTLTYTHPIFQTLIGVLTERRSVHWFLILAVLLGFIGCVVLLNPQFSSDTHFAALIGILAGLFTALAYARVGKLVRGGEHELRIIFYFALVTTLLSVSITQLTGGFTVLTAQDTLWIFALGVFGTLGQMALTRAYGRANPIVVGTLAYSQIIFSLLLGYWFFSENISSSMIFGVALIIASGVLVLFKRIKA